MKRHIQTLKPFGFRLLFRLHNNSLCFFFAIVFNYLSYSYGCIAKCQIFSFQHSYRMRISIIINENEKKLLYWLLPYHSTSHFWFIHCSNYDAINVCYEFAIPMVTSVLRLKLIIIYFLLFFIFSLIFLIYSFLFTKTVTKNVFNARSSKNVIKRPKAIQQYIKISKVQNHRILSLQTKAKWHKKPQHDFKNKSS